MSSEKADFEQAIRGNLSHFRGIVQNPDRVSQLAEILTRLRSSGYTKLVSNFCNQTDPDLAFSFVIELWFCKSLLDENRVKNLEYEPSTEKNPPDFRCSLDGVQFDIQIKWVRQVYNEIIKDRFERECRRQLSHLPQNWLINYSLSNHFMPRHINQFLQFIRANIPRFQPITGENAAIPLPWYCWEVNGQTLARFHFFHEEHYKQGIYPGIIESWSENGLAEEINIEKIRHTVKTHVDKSLKTLNYPVSATQSNLVVIFPEWETWLSQVADDVFFGTETLIDRIFADGTRKMIKTRSVNGLFHNQHMRRVSGIILLHESSDLIGGPFKGRFFVNSDHNPVVKDHPKLFTALV